MKLSEIINSILDILKSKKISIAEQDLMSKYKQVKLIYSKRYVLEKNLLTKMPLDVRDFVRQSKTLIVDKGKVTFNDVMNEVLIYIYDNWVVNGALDVWQFPEETNILRKGDCEDMTFYRISKIISNNKIYDGILFAALGFVNFNDGRGWIGHAFPVLWQNKELIIYEATDNSDKKMNPKNYEIYYLFNDKYCFEIKKGKFGTNAKKLLKEFGLKKIK